MKNNNIGNQAGNQNIQFNKNKPAPEMRDNLDSRMNEEQTNRGGHTTHNRKERKEKQPKSKK